MRDLASQDRKRRRPDGPQAKRLRVGGNGNRSSSPCAETQAEALAELDDLETRIAVITAMRLPSRPVLASTQLGVGEYEIVVVAEDGA
jgi:hypothetical protein